LILTFFYQIYKRNEIVKFLQLLHRFDSQAGVLEIKMMNGRVSKRIAIINTIVVSVMMLCGLISSITFKLQLHYDVDMFMPIGYTFMLIAMMVLFLQLMYAIVAVKRRLQHLNLNLRFTFMNETVANKISVINLHCAFNVDVIPETFTNLYNELFDGIELINNAFTLQLIPIVIIYLVVNIFTMYSTAREIILQTSLIWGTCLTNFMWFTLTTLFLSMVLHAGYSTTKCARQVATIVGIILKHPKHQNDKNLRRVFKSFLLEMQYKNFSFENEIFRIEWKLLVSVNIFLSVQNFKGPTFVLIHRLCPPCCRLSWLYQTLIRD
jgi:hypothetical protein